jgi:hypothetical protein
MFGAIQIDPAKVVWKGESSRPISLAVAAACPRQDSKYLRKMDARTSTGSMKTRRNSGDRRDRETMRKQNGKRVLLAERHRRQDVEDVRD